jgi:hypothetical protein
VTPNAKPEKKPVIKPSPLPPKVESDDDFVPISTMVTEHPMHYSEAIPELRFPGKVPRPRRKPVAGDGNGKPEDPHLTELFDLIQFSDSPPPEKPVTPPVVELPSPVKEPEPFSVKNWVHSTFNIPFIPFERPEQDREDAIFASQEQLCSLIEIEIVREDGAVQRVLPTKLNRYLQAVAVRPDADWIPVLPKATYAGSRNVFGDSPSEVGTRDADNRPISSVLIAQHSSDYSD